MLLSAGQKSLPAKSWSAVARNLGVDAASGSIAFYDSEICGFRITRGLHYRIESCPDVDWVYGSCRLVEFATEWSCRRAASTRAEQTPFLELSVRRSGNLRVIVDGARPVHDHQRPHVGLQCSVLRRRVFDSVRIPSFRIGEIGTRGSYQSGVSRHISLMSTPCVSTTKKRHTSDSDKGAEKAPMGFESSFV